MPSCRNNSIKDGLFVAFVCCRGGFCALNEENRELLAGPNERYEEEIGEDTCSLPSRQGSLFFKLTALLVVIIFTVLVLGGFLEIFTLPALDFLVESQKLSRDPLVQELKQAVVRITAAPEESRSDFQAAEGTVLISVPRLIVIPFGGGCRLLSVSFPGREAAGLPVGQSAPLQTGADNSKAGNFPLLLLKGSHSLQ